MILTLTETGDDHALYVQEALRAKGSDATLWFTTDLAQLQAVSIEVGEDSGGWLRATGPDLSLGSEPPRVIWLRRPTPPVLTDDLHPADRTWARKEYEEFHGWLLRGLGDTAFWINTFESSRRARSKLLQQQVAQRVGLRVPRTLYSNDPAEIRAFLRAQGGRGVYKPFTQTGVWKLKNEAVAVLFTSLLTEADLPGDETLRASPGIYQPCLPKAYELRVTVMGRHVFPAKVNSQAMKQGRLDWRRSLTDVHLHFEPIELRPELIRAILRLMEEMGLVFGCLDFIVTPDGEHVFLEVNEMGQFLFVEDYIGVPLLDAFCEMLLQGRPDFTWDPSRATVHLSDFERRVEERKIELARDHIMPLENVVGIETDDIEPGEKGAME